MAEADFFMPNKLKLFYEFYLLQVNLSDDNDLNY